MTQAVFKKEFTLHFRGDALDLDPDQVYGPNTMGELFRVVCGDYDPVTDRTTVHYEVIRTTDLPALAQKKIAEVYEAERIRALFGTGS